MPRLIVATLVRNESAKFWRSALSQWSRFADEILVLDDQSTDSTAEIALAAGAKVFTRSGGAWGNESPARQQLFDLAMQEARPKDWVAILDADMTFARDPRELALAGSVNVWAFPLYDLWGVDPLRYRADQFWFGHDAPRVWLVERPSILGDYKWSEKGIHAGHIPLNFEVKHPGAGVAPREYALLHYAYAFPELRERKIAQYATVREQLSNWQWAHTMSIGDPEPQVYTLPFTPEFTLEYEGNPTDERWRYAS